jgi:hypothetical protein
LTLEQWRDLSLILLLFEAAAVILSAGIALFYTIRVTAMLDRELRARLPIIRRKTQQVAAQTTALSATVAEPIIATSSRLSQAQRMADSLVAPLKQKGRG